MLVLKALDILGLVTIASPLIPVETLGARGEHRHARNANVVLATVIGMWQIALTLRRALQGTVCHTRWCWCHAVCGWFPFTGQTGQAGQSAAATAAAVATTVAGVNNVADGDLARLRDWLFRRSLSWITALAIALSAAAQLALGAPVVPVRATTTLMPMQMAVGANEVQLAIGGMGQKVGAKVSAFNMVRVVTLHGTHGQASLHIDGHKDRLWPAQPPIVIDIRKSTGRGGSDCGNAIHLSAVHLFGHIAHRFNRVEVKALIAVEERSNRVAGKVRIAIQRMGHQMTVRTSVTNL